MPRREGTSDGGRCETGDAARAAINVGTTPARPPSAWPQSRTRLYQASVHVRSAASVVSGRIACSRVPRGAAVTPHAVEHSEKCRGDQPRQARRRCGREVAEAGEQRRHDQRSPSSEAIGCKCHDHSHRGDAGETGADNHAGAGDGHARFGKGDREKDADEADGRRSQECCDVDQRSIATQIGLLLRRRGPRARARLIDGRSKRGRQLLRGPFPQ